MKNPFKIGILGCSSCRTYSKGFIKRLENNRKKISVLSIGEKKKNVEISAFFFISNVFL